MACAEAVMNQETKLLKALQSAERFAVDGSALSIHCAGMDKPLRFVRKEP
jgi:heat shock protein HslJ